MRQTGHYDMLVDLIKNDLIVDEDLIKLAVANDYLNLDMGPYICKLLAQFKPELSADKKIVTFKDSIWTFKNVAKLGKTYQFVEQF